jgi:MoaA/NifB/PqqE/SkfB family radical SAM enzyme
MAIRDGYLVNVLKSRLSPRSRTFLKLVYDVSTNPSRTKAHLNRLQYAGELLKNPEIGFVPPVFIATITDECNLRCPNCLFILNPDNKFFNSFITPEKFRTVLEKHNPDRKADVMFLTGGEPLMHPKLDELIDISKEYKLTVKMSTNGMLVKKNISLLRRLDYINVSMDSYDAETFGRYRGGTPKQFETIVEGLTALRENGIYFSTSFVLSAENIDEADRMLEFTRRVRPNTVIFHNINPHGSPDFNSLRVDHQKTKEWLKRMVERSDYPFDVSLPAVFDPTAQAFVETKCVQPWLYFSFNSVGDISLCCHLEHDSKYGNAFQDDAFNAPEMVEFRSEIIKGKMSTPLMQRSCMYCHRRFMNSEYGTFDSHARKWFIHN